MLIMNKTRLSCDNNSEISYSSKEVTSDNHLIHHSFLS